MESKNKKIIIVGEKEKISAEMLGNIKEHYDCEIIIMTPDEYADFKQKENIMDDFINECIAEEQKEIELCLHKLENMEYLPSLTQKEKIKPYVPQKTGRINNKKLAHAPKQYNNRKRMNYGRC